MVKTGQGLVLGATMGSRPALKLLLAKDGASRSLFLFTGCLTTPWLWVRFAVVSPPLAACGSSVGGGHDSDRGLGFSGTLTK